MVDELRTLLTQLQNPAFGATVLEPFLFWGVLTGTCGWILSRYILRNRKAQVCSLILLAAASFAIQPVQHLRHQAAAESGSGEARTGHPADRRHETRWVYYTMGGLALGAMFLTGESRGRFGSLLAITTGLAGLATAVFSLWLAGQEFQARHPDARKPPAVRRN